MEHEDHTIRAMPKQSVLLVNRQLTNKIFGIIFIISFLLWLIVVAYGKVKSTFGPLKYTSVNPIFDFHELCINRIISIALSYILLCALYTLIVFIALRWIPHVSSIIFWALWILVSVYIAAAIHEATFWTIYAAIGSIFNCVFLMILLNMEWFHLSEKVVKESCKMVISVPSTAVFAFVACLLNALIIAILVIEIEKLISSDQSLLSIVLLILNFVFGVWTVVTVAAISLMTLSGTFAEYYWTDNKDSISLVTVLRIFALNCRYHIGTAAMCHPLLGGSIALFYQVALVLHTISKDASIRKICFFVYNIFDMVVLRIAILGSAARCGIKGENFHTSMRGALTLLSRTSRTLTVVKVTELLLELSTLTIMTLTAFSVLGYLNHTIPSESQNSWQQLFSVLVMLGGTVFIVTFLTCLTAASYSIMICLEEELEQLRRGVPQSCAMSSNLRSALNHDGPPNWFRDSWSHCIPSFKSDDTYEWRL